MYNCTDDVREAFPEFSNVELTDLFHDSLLDLDKLMKAGIQSLIGTVSSFIVKAMMKKAMELHWAKVHAAEHGVIFMAI